MFNTPITQSIKRLNNSREGYKTMENKKEDNLDLLVSIKLDSEALQVKLEEQQGTLASIKDDIEQLNRYMAKLDEVLNNLKENI